MQNLFFLLIFSFQFVCCSPKKNGKDHASQEPLVIESFYAVNQTAGLGEFRLPDRPGLDTSIIQYFLINAHKLDDNISAKLDSFSCSLLGKKLVKYNTHMITFFHKSEFTNNEYLLANPRILARYSQENDLLIRYTWFHDCNDGLKFIYSDGSIIKSERIDCNCDQPNIRK